MKNFMFLFRGPSPEDLKFTPEQSQQSMQKWFGWINELREKDLYVGGEPLISTGKTVQGKKPVVTDGPFAEGKELVGGYIIIKADSLEDATELAFGFPDFGVQGSVEVREVMQMPMP
ncbi:YciI family protein [Flavitalea flava]